jgi:hypothetical protein
VTRILALLMLLGVGCLGPRVDTRTWLRLENGSFVVWSVASPESTRAVADALERFRTATAVLLRLRRPAAAVKLPILVVEDVEEVRGRCGRNAVGCFDRNPNGSTLTIWAGASDDVSRQIVRHEYIHALLRYHAYSVPLWFEEGLAELLSTLEVDGNDVVLGRAPARVASGLRLLNEGRMRWVPLARALRYLERCHGGDRWSKRSSARSERRRTTTGAAR